MVAPIWIPQVILAFLTAVSANELLPERYLKPQDFNHHPFTDVGVPASLKRSSNHPYAILAKKRPREGREFPPQDVVYYPTPHPSTISRKQLETNEIGPYEDPYVNAPKNYAFSYIVKDQNSADFSHSQAHNGQATRGQYRVKLPDGRVQIVSYTADNKGYRADVQYENELPAKPHKSSHSAAPGKLSQISPSTYQNAPSHGSPQVFFSLQSPGTPTPAQYSIGDPNLNQLIGYQPQYSSHSVSTTPAPYHQNQYVSSTGPVQFVPQHYVSSTPLYSVGHAPTTAAPPAQQQENQHYHHVSSTASPQNAVIVTPRPFYNRGLVKNEDDLHALLYSIL